MNNQKEFKEKCKGFYQLALFYFGRTEREIPFKNIFENLHWCCFEEDYEDCHLMEEIFENVSDDNFHFLRTKYPNSYHYENYH